MKETGIFKLIDGKEHYYAEWVGLAKKPWGSLVYCLDEYCSVEEFTAVLGIMIRMAPVVEHISRN